MEKDQCVWTKRKYLMSSNLTSSSPTSYPSSHDDSSWEEQAFAKDAAGLGCIWPPRSYSCSFCRREFRSAQALGGHMNVHRRDRAKINQQQQSSPHQNELLSHHDLQTTHPHNHVQNSLTPGYLYPSSPCGLAYNNTNPNNSDPLHVLDSSSKNFREETLIPLYNSSIFHKTSPALSSKSWSNLAEGGVERISKGLDSGCRSYKGDKDKSDHVAVSLNLFVCRAYTPVQFETKEADHVCLKKRKTEASSNPFFPKSSSVDTHHMQSQMFEFSPSSIEELDLELRLGCRPKGIMQFNTQNSNDQSGPGQVKFYTCSFCKRGFSNAQALGGHMNTHRRDRAKLKQSSEENLLSLDISIKNSIDQEPVPLEEKILFRLDSGGEEKHARNHKKPFTFLDKDNDIHATPKGKVIGAEELSHLPSFVGMITAINEIRGEADLDLELRLGPKPHEAPTLSTIEFF